MIAAPLLALALAAEDPIAGCEVYDKGAGVGLMIQCADKVVAQIVAAPAGANGAAMLETLQIAARSNSTGVEFSPLEAVVAGKKRHGFRLAPTKGKLARVGTALLFENDADTRVVTCLAPPELADARCPAVFERLASEPLPAVTHVEDVKLAPYTQTLFRGEPELKAGCAFSDGNSITCKNDSVFWGSLRSHDDPKGLIATMKKAVPSSTPATISERPCDVAGAHPGKCQVLMAGDGTVHSFVILADVQLDATWYRIECRVRGSIAKGPAPSPCQQLISFTTDVLGDEEPRDSVIVVFNKSLPAGATVTLDDLSQRKVPASLASASVVKPKDSSYVVGQRLIEPVEEADPVYWAQIASAMKLVPCGKAPKPLDPKGLSTPYDHHGASMREVVVAAQDLEEGRVIALANLSARTYRSDLVGQYVVDAIAVKKLVGQKTIMPILAGDPIRIPWLAGYADQATRCRVIKEELGNVFEERGAPPEIAKRPCPAGTHASSGAPKSSEKAQTPSAIGWLYQCLEKDGTPHGPFGKWQRRGMLIALGSFAHGKRDGAWSAPGLEAHFSAGELDGPKIETASGGADVETGTFKQGWRDGEQKFVQRKGTVELQYVRGVPKRGWGPGKGEPVLVAARELHTGDVLAEGDLTSVLIDEPMLHWVVTADSVRYVVGQPLLCNLAKGAPLFWSDLDQLK